MSIFERQQAIENRTKNEWNEWSKSDSNYQGKRNDYQREYWRKNKEKLKLKRAQRKEEEKKIKHEYYEAHKDEFAERSAQYYEKHKEKVKLAAKENKLKQKLSEAERQERRRKWNQFS